MTNLIDVFEAAASRPVIMCDVDNTLAWTMNQSLAVLNSMFGLNTTLADVTRYDFVANLPLEQSTWLNQQFARDVFYSTIAPDYHAIDAVNTLHDRGYKVVVVTSRPSQMKDATENWLAEWNVSHDQLLVGPGVKINFVRSTQSPIVAIDDNPSDVLELASAGASVWTPTRTYTPTWLKECRMSNIKLFGSWDELTRQLA